MACRPCEAHARRCFAPFKIGRRASRSALPRGAWEQQPSAASHDSSRRAHRSLRSSVEMPFWTLRVRSLWRGASPKACVSAFLDAHFIGSGRQIGP
ncbi:hypothetical protein F4W67_08020 [Pseudomonas caricapapayae]|nr:hypothetical protein F4W67_08020 [Pseudomonas caricapapayae]